jgi:hypothetical protein
VKFTKQLIFDRIHQRYNKNFGIEFEANEGILYDSILAAVIENKKMIYFKTFIIKKKQFDREYDGRETYIECENNLTVFEFEQKIRQTFLLEDNVKIVNNMKKPNQNTYIKDFEKFQLAFKDVERNYILSSLFERIYEVTMLEKSYVFVGKCFNGWNIND